MAIVFVSDNYSDFINLGETAFEVYTGADLVGSQTAYEGAVARAAISLENGAAAKSQPFTAVGGDFWAHFRVSMDDHRFGVPIVEFLDATGTLIYDLRQVFDNVSDFELHVNDGSDTHIGTTFAIPLDNLHSMDINIQPGVGGSADVYIGGVNVSTFSGNIVPTGKDITTIVVRGTGQTNFETFFSEMVITNAQSESTIDYRVTMLLLDSVNGTIDDWSSDSANPWEDIDEIPLDRGDIIFSTAVADRSAFGFESVPAEVGTSSVVVSVSAFVDVFRGVGSTPTGVDVFVITGSEDAGTSLAALTEGIPSKQRVEYTTDPHTGVAWTQSDLNTAEFGVKTT